MAEQELPLVDIKAIATVLHASKGGFTVTFTIGADAPRKEEHRRQMAAFYLGKNGEKPVRMTLWRCPDDWEAAVDPESGEEAVDPTAQLHDEWRSLVARMTSDADLQS